MTTWTGMHENRNADQGDMIETTVAQYRCEDIAPASFWDGLAAMEALGGTQQQFARSVACTAYWGLPTEAKERAA